MTPQDFIDELYLVLLKQGWKMHEIDEMDIIHYLNLLKRKLLKERVYIDDVL